MRRACLHNPSLHLRKRAAVPVAAAAPPAKAAAPAVRAARVAKAAAALAAAPAALRAPVAAAKVQVQAPAAALTCSPQSCLSEVRSEKPAQMNLKKTNHKLLSDNHFDKGI